MDFLIKVSILICGRLNLFISFFLPNCTLSNYSNDRMWNACNTVINTTRIRHSFHCWPLATCISNIFDLRVRLKRSNVHSGVRWTIICLLSAVTAKSGKYTSETKSLGINEAGIGFDVNTNRKSGKYHCLIFATHAESSVFPVLGQILFETNFVELVFQ